MKKGKLDVCMCNREEILAMAAMGCEVGTVQKLCDLPGIDVNAGNPLKWAAFHNNKAIIEILAEDPELGWNAGDRSGGNPITSALDNGYDGIVKILLEQQTLDLNFIDSKGRSVGHCAVEYRFLKKHFPKRKNEIAFPVKCVELLSKDRRVNWNVRDQNGETPIMIAMKNKEMEMVKILLKTPGVNLKDLTKIVEGSLIQDLLKEMLHQADESARSFASNVPECPVCLSQFNSYSRVFQCSEGHFVCEKCNPRVEHCPVCREEMMGRAHGFERFLQDLNL